MFKFSYFRTPLYLVCCLLFLFAVSCGGSPVASIPASESSEFVEWKSGLPQTPKGFVDWWNSTAGGKRNWRFSYYNQNGLTYPDTSTPEEIFQSKLINCLRFSILCKSIFGGEIKIYRQSGSYDHATLKLTSGEELSMNTDLTVTIKEK